MKNFSKSFFQFSNRYNFWTKGPRPLKPGWFLVSGPSSIICQSGAKSRGGLLGGIEEKPQVSNFSPIIHGFNPLYFAKMPGTIMGLMHVSQAKSRRTKACMRHKQRAGELRRACVTSQSNCQVEIFIAVRVEIHVYTLYVGTVWAKRVTQVIIWKNISLPAAVLVYTFMMTPIWVVHASHVRFWVFLLWV